MVLLARILYLLLATVLSWSSVAQAEPEVVYRPGREVWRPEYNDRESTFRVRYEVEFDNGLRGIETETWSYVGIDPHTGYGQWRRIARLNFPNSRHTDQVTDEIILDRDYMVNRPSSVRGQNKHPVQPRKGVTPPPMLMSGTLSYPTGPSGPGDETVERQGRTRAWITTEAAQRVLFRRKLKEGIVLLPGGSSLNVGVIFNYGVLSQEWFDKMEEAYLNYWRDGILSSIFPNQEVQEEHLPPLPPTPRIPPGLKTNGDNQHPLILPGSPFPGGFGDPPTPPTTRPTVTLPGASSGSGLQPFMYAPSPGQGEGEGLTLRRALPSFGPGPGQRQPGAIDPRGLVLSPGIVASGLPTILEYSGLVTVGMTVAIAGAPYFVAATATGTETATALAASGLQLMRAANQGYFLVRTLAGAAGALLIVPQIGCTTQGCQPPPRPQLRMAPGQLQLVPGLAPPGLPRYELQAPTQQLYLNPR